MTGDVFYPGDLVEVVTSSNKAVIGTVGRVVEIIDGQYYNLDTLPDYCFDAAHLRKAEAKEDRKTEKAMRYRQDYRVTVRASIDGLPYWTMEYKGEPRVPDDGDLAVISGMLGEVKDSIDRHLNKQKGE